jgi:hypothetical protein
VLRAWGLRLAAAVYGEPAWRDKADAIGAAIAARYAPANGPRHPPAAHTPVRTFETFDLAACALLALSGVAPRSGGRRSRGSFATTSMPARSPPRSRR